MVLMGLPWQAAAACSVPGGRLERGCHNQDPKQAEAGAGSCSPLAWDVQVHNFALVVLHFE